MCKVNLSIFKTQLYPGWIGMNIKCNMGVVVSIFCHTHCWIHTWTCVYGNLGLCIQIHVSVTDCEIAKLDGLWIYLGLQCLAFITCNYLLSYCTYKVPTGSGKPTWNTFTPNHMWLLLLQVLYTSHSEWECLKKSWIKLIVEKSSNLFFTQKSWICLKSLRAS